jgi:hypothetical protein
MDLNLILIGLVVISLCIVFGQVIELLGNPLDAAFLTTVVMAAIVLFKDDLLGYSRQKSIQSGIDDSGNQSGIDDSGNQSGIDDSGNQSGIDDYTSLNFLNEAHAIKMQPELTNLDSATKKILNKVNHELYQDQRPDQQYNEQKQENTMECTGFSPVEKTNKKKILQEHDQRYGCHGDDALASRMKYMSTMNKRAMDAQAKQDKNSVSYLFEEELSDNNNRDWWENQDLEYLM